MKIQCNSIFKSSLCLVFLFLVGCSDESAKEQQSRLLAGEEIVKKNCLVCHAQGINGAPIVGNQKMWSKRIPKGREALVQNAINGFGLMPPKGGKTQLTDEEIDLAVGYYLAELDKK